MPRTSCRRCGKEFETGPIRAALCHSCRKRWKTCVDCGKPISAARSKRYIRCSGCRKDRLNRYRATEPIERGHVIPSPRPAIRYREFLAEARAAGVEFPDAIVPGLAYALDGLGGEERRQWKIALFELGGIWSDAYYRSPDRPLLNRGLLEHLEPEPAEYVRYTVVG